MFLTQEIIRKKRDGGALSAKKSSFSFAASPTAASPKARSRPSHGRLFNDMNMDERVAFTLAMRDSGQVMEWKS